MLETSGTLSMTDINLIIIENDLITKIFNVLRWSNSILVEMNRSERLRCVQRIVDLNCYCYEFVFSVFLFFD